MKLKLKIMIVLHNDRMAHDKEAVLSHYEDTIKAERRRITEVDSKTGDLEKHVKDLEEDLRKLEEIEDWDSFRDKILKNEWRLC